MSECIDCEHAKRKRKETYELAKRYARKSNIQEVAIIKVKECDCLDFTTEPEINPDKYEIVEYLYFGTGDKF